jgi:hypothetical protein
LSLASLGRGGRAGRRRSCRTAAVAAGLLALAGFGALAWHMSRDPLAMLPYADAAPVVSADEVRVVGGRTFRDVVIETGTIGQARVRLSLPQPPPAEPIPVVLVLGGLRTGRSSVSLVGDAGRNALVGYDWPLPARIERGPALLASLPELQLDAVTVPGQIEAVLRWIEGQPWADRSRTSLLGFSLGALAAPAVQRLLEAKGHRVGWTVLAYGGAPLGEVAARHPRIRPDWLRPVVRAAVDVLLRALEPAEHLPRLGGCFLVLSGSDDELIPAGAARRLAALAPPCKTIATIEGEHLGAGPDEAGLLAQVLRQSAEWLTARGAINPVPALQPP